MQKIRLVFGLVMLLALSPAAEARSGSGAPRHRGVQKVMKKFMVSHAQSVVTRANAGYKPGDHACVLNTSVRLIKVGKRRVQFEGKYSVAFKVADGKQEWRSGKTVTMRGEISRAELDRFAVSKGKQVPGVKEHKRPLDKVLASIKDPYHGTVTSAVNRLKNPAEIRDFVNLVAHFLVSCFPRRPYPSVTPGQGSLSGSAAGAAGALSASAI